MLAVLSYPRHGIERVAFALVVMLILIAIFGPWLAPYDPTQIDFRNRMSPPSAAHWFGTDGSGRDVLSRLLAGAQLTLLSTAAVISAAVVIGLALGFTSAFVGGTIDNLLMRFADIWLSFPPLILALGFAAALGASLEAAIVALIVSWWPNYARLSRMIAADILTRKFMASADALGVSVRRKVTHYVLPNAMDVLVIQITLDISAVMLAISGLSFIGVGAQIPDPEWGAMIADGRSHVSTAWWVVTFPGLMIFITALSFNIMGDMLRRELDPTLQRRG
jgi:peptide/nickel transport system permease protein